MILWPNQSAAGKAGIASRLAIEHPCPGLPEPAGWPSTEAIGELSTIGNKLNTTESLKGCRRACLPGRLRAPLSAIKRAGKMGVAICLFAGSISAWAGYVVDSHVETAAGTNHYSWTVYNEDQSWGLDGFAIEVPVQTRVLAHTVPAPHSNPDRNAYWIMEERYEASVDPHDGQVSIPAPRPGMKLLWWWGMESPSVYPPGTTVTFSVTTDSSVGPGIASGSALTYTPQNNPHYYVSWRGQMLGPGTGAADRAPTSLTGNDANKVLPVVRTLLMTNLESGATSQRAALGTDLPAASISMHAGVPIEGEVGLQYGIQYNTDLSDTNGWRGLANVILTTPKQVWYDPQPAFNFQRFYRIATGPIPIP